jgi:hypothetical protein
MAKSPKPKTSASREGVTASGIVEAIEQDMELSMEQVKDAAQHAVAAVEKKFGGGKSAKPKPKAVTTTKLKKRK